MEHLKFEGESAAYRTARNALPGEFEPKMAYPKCH